jgi:hypothetical protein
VCDLSIDPGLDRLRSASSPVIPASTDRILSAPGPAAFRPPASAAFFPKAMDSGSKRLGTRAPGPPDRDEIARLFAP